MSIQGDIYEENEAKRLEEFYNELMAIPLMDGEQRLFNEILEKYKKKFYHTFLAFGEIRGYWDIDASTIPYCYEEE